MMPQINLLILIYVHTRVIVNIRDFSNHHRIKARIPYIMFLTSFSYVLLNCNIFLPFFNVLQEFIWA